MPKSPARHHLEEMVPRGYYQALGRLTHALATVEVELAATIHVILYVGTKPPNKTGHYLINAVTGGMRYDVLKDTIKRLLRVSKASKATCDYIDKLFSHLSDIQWLRNRLHHHVTIAVTGERHSLQNTDEHTVRELDKAHTFGFSPEVLQAAAMDAYAFNDALNQWVAMMETGEEFNPPRLPAWQYKPSMLIRGGR